MALAAVAVVSLIVLDLTRTSLAVTVVRSWLSSHGAASQIEVYSLSDHALSAKVRLGSAASPDLTIDRLDMTYRLGPGLGGRPVLTPLSVVMVRPRLKVSVVKGRPDFGGLDRLVRWLSALPPSHRPLPDVAIKDGVILVGAPQGPIRLTGSGVFKNGRLSSAEGQLASGRWSAGGAALISDGGRFWLQRQGPTLVGGLDLGPSQITTRTSAARLSSLSFNGSLPYPKIMPGETAPPLQGKAQLNLAGSQLQGRSALGEIRDGSLHGQFIGQIFAASNRQQATGRLRADLAGDASLASGHGAGANGRTVLRGIRLHLALPDFTLNREGGRLSAQAAGQARLTVGQADTADLRLTDLTTEVTLDQVRLATGAAGLSGGASIAGHSAGRGSLTTLALARIDRAIPLLDGQRPYATALGRALSAFAFTAADWRLTLDPQGERMDLVAPARLETASGAHLTLSGHAVGQGQPVSRATGSAALTLAGGGLPNFSLALDSLMVDANRVAARFNASARVDLAQVRGGQASAHGQFDLSRGGMRLALSDCAPISAHEATFGAASLTAISARLCPDAAPLITTSGSHWSLEGKVKSLEARSAALAVGLNQGALSFTAQGAANGPERALVVVDSADLVDQAGSVRFAPLSLLGRLALIDNQWTGSAAARTLSGKPLGSLRLVDNVKTGVGRADVDTGTLVFAPGRFQPQDVTPTVTFAKQLTGAARFSGWYGWSGKGQMQSGGELFAKALSFDAPFGPVHNLDGDLHFTSLSPLTTAPGQQITIGAVQTVTPVTDIKLVFRLGANHLQVDQAHATLARGLVSLEPFTAPLTTKTAFSSALDLHLVDVGQIIAATSLAESVQLSARVDGRIPFTLGPSSLTVQQGEIAAVGGGRLSISPKALTGVSASKAPTAAPGFAQDFAYQALQNLVFQRLDATLASLPDKRMSMVFHIKGRHEPPTVQKAKIPLFDLLGGKALARSIPLPSGTEINLTLDTSLNFGDLISALEEAWREAMQPGRASVSAKRIGPPGSSQPPAPKGSAS